MKTTRRQLPELMEALTHLSHIRSKKIAIALLDNLNIVKKELTDSNPIITLEGEQTEEVIEFRKKDRELYQSFCLLDESGQFKKDNNGNLLFDKERQEEYNTAVEEKKTNDPHYGSVFARILEHKQKVTKYMNEEVELKFSTITNEDLPEDISLDEIDLMDSVGMLSNKRRLDA